VHQNGVIHRDIKPGNVILRGRRWNEPVLVDFGLVKGVGGSKFTRTGLVMGTEGYVAPEVEAGEPATTQSDQWSFARLAAELLLWSTGGKADEISDDLRLRAPGSARLELLLERLQEETFVSTASTVSVFEQALSPDPEDRFPSVTEFATAFEEALFEDGVLERETPAGSYSGAHWDKRKSLVTFIKELGFPVSDKRPLDGALWVVAGDEFQPMADYLRTRGIDFRVGSGRTTGHQPGWWAKTRA
jgi:serine/threonine protein kinase